MTKPIEATSAVGKGSDGIVTPVTPRKTGNQLTKFWEELDKHRFVPNTTYSPANPSGHISFANVRPGTSYGTASATNP